MKEIVVVSGKGGSGKTTLAASLAYMLHQEGFRVVAADTDVDTPTLHFMLPIKKREKKFEIYMSRKAYVDEAKCDSCYKCLDVCPYGAIELQGEGLKPKVNSFYCEGCGACALACPRSAIEMREARTGFMLVGECEFGFPIITAQLEVGEHNTGPLVHEIRDKAAEIAKSLNADVLVTDGSPGIGCTVIASISGASYVAVVSEPTPQSFRGGFRAAKIAQQFRIPLGFAINKSMGYKIEEEAEKIISIMNVKLIGKIPYDYSVVEALTMMRPVVAHKPDSPASRAIKIVSENIKVGAGLK